MDSGSAGLSADRTAATGRKYEDGGGYPEYMGLWGAGDQ